MKIATQPAFIYSKLTIETLEQGVRCSGIVLVSLLFTPCSSVSNVNFEHVKKTSSHRCLTLY